MNNNIWAGKEYLLVCFLGVVTILCMVFRYLEKNKIVSRRKIISLEDIYNSSVKNSGVKFEIFQEVYTELGKSYGIDPRLIRVTDKIKSYMDYDSWILSEGTEKINEWIQKKTNIENIKIKIETVLDLLILIDTNYKSEEIREHQHE